MDNFTLEMGQTGSPETSVKNHHTPRNNPEHGKILHNNSGTVMLAINLQVKEGNALSSFLEI
jgi:hypothetical protein